MRLIRLDRFGFMHITFSSMVKFQFFAQFPVDHIAHSVVPWLILLSRSFATFDYYVIKSCVLLLLLLLVVVVLADGFSLEFEWQQVSSSLQDSSQYSGRPQQCCRLDSLYPSANFQVLQAL